jgi:hypothetical protein
MYFINIIRINNKKWWFTRDIDIDTTTRLIEFTEDKKCGRAAKNVVIACWAFLLYKGR